MTAAWGRCSWSRTRSSRLWLDLARSPGSAGRGRGAGKAGLGLGGWSPSPAGCRARARCLLEVESQPGTETVQTPAAFLQIDLHEGAHGFASFPEGYASARARKSGPPPRLPGVTLLMVCLSGVRVGVEGGSGPARGRVCVSRESRSLWGLSEPPFPHP